MQLACGHDACTYKLHCSCWTVVVLFGVGFLYISCFRVYFLERESEVFFGKMNKFLQEKKLDEQKESTLFY